MGSNSVKIISPSNSEKSPSPLQEQPSVYTYPDWASMEAYYGPGVPMPPPFFNASVASGHPPHAYTWSPQPITSPFVGPYAAIYPHGCVYSHPSAVQLTSPVNQEVPSKSSTSKEKVLKKSKMLGLSASINGNSECAGCNVNLLSQSGENEGGSSDGSNGNSESGGSKNKRSRSSEDMPNTEIKAPSTISLGSSVAPTTVTGKSSDPVPLPNLTSDMDTKASGITRAKPEGAIVLSTCTPMDERELKREKRKQSNRESARRSRMRKQAETEELAIKVGILTTENTTLRSEITQLTESSKKLRIENSSLMEKLKVQPIDNDGSPAIVVENLLSRLDNSIAVGGSTLMEDEPRESSRGKIHQLLVSNPRTDAVAAS